MTVGKATFPRPVAPVVAGAVAAFVLGAFPAVFADSVWAWLASLAGLAGLLLAATRAGSAALERGAVATPSAAAGGETDPLAVLAPRALLAAVPDPVVLFDRTGLLLHANPAAEAAFGALPPGLSLPLRFRAPELAGLIGDALAGRALAGERAAYSERVPLERDFAVEAAALGGGILALVFREGGEARRIDRMRADFVANASHELRTPLASIAGFVETLRGPARDDAAARDRFLAIMEEQTARMSRLIDDLLSLSRLESRPYLDLDRTVDLAAAARDVLQALGPLAAETGVRLELAAGEGPWLVGGSRDELFQVLENLVENACKYGASGGRVLVGLERDGDGGTALSVRDWGPGIAGEHLPRVTERFYRADVASSRAKRGTGLGLAIVKHIATRHRARLSIRSAPGEGATFTLHFPPAQGGGKTLPDP